MALPTLEFGLFLGLVFGLYWASRSPSARRGLLLLASLFFYGTWEFQRLVDVLFALALAVVRVVWPDGVAPFIYAAF